MKNEKKRERERDGERNWKQIKGEEGIEIAVI